MLFFCASHYTKQAFIPAFNIPRAKNNPPKLVFHSNSEKQSNTIHQECASLDIFKYLIIIFHALWTLFTCI